jgi:hypothetical protein
VRTSETAIESPDKITIQARKVVAAHGLDKRKVPKERDATLDKTNLVLGDLADGKVRGLLVAKVETRDGSSWHHGKRLGEGDAGIGLDVHQVPHGDLLSVVWLAGVTWSWADTVVLELVELLCAEMLVAAVAPVGATNILVQGFSISLGKTVRKRLHHDDVVVIVLLLEAVAQLVGPKTAGHGKRTNVVSDAWMKKRGRARSSRIHTGSTGENEQINFAQKQAGDQQRKPEWPRKPPGRERDGKRRKNTKKKRGGKKTNPSCRTHLIPLAR